MQDKEITGKGKVKWITTEWLESNLNSEKIQIIDVQPNVHDYMTEHIPGAVYMNENLMRLPENGIPARYISREVMQEHMRRLGIVDDKALVVYSGKGVFKGWGDGLEQDFMAYTFSRFGHCNVLILDGGLEKWKEESRPLTQEFPEVKESKFQTNIQEDFFIDYKGFKNIKDSEEVIVIDSRPPSAYRNKSAWGKPGHIPGAINLPWPYFFKKDNFYQLKSDEDIQHLVKKYGLSRDKTIICTCGTGREATASYLILKWYLEFPTVKIWEGSFTEWSAHPENETVTGPDPR
ncbi:MAG: sulfurtransferase [Bacteroidota bacterium]|nr:sulfurtransferase [Bacteroidota bacterium]